ncbi:hypothetical protein RvY_02558 [Ramazzottius varieornatus]|uniref:Uncharacterized protein n=1 Tax=Ramazzottius varieornatus TaxID=947166 RepID=A0A1D1UK62_RAMVA|nr:hypothetical protein RvY_02558 [Ramazzottius varieornatus]
MLENVNVSGTKVCTVVPKDLSEGDEGTCRNSGRKVQRMRESAVGCASDYCNSRRTEDVLRRWKALPANVEDKDYYEEKKVRFCPATCQAAHQEDIHNPQTHGRPRPANNINRLCQA